VVTPKPMDAGLVTTRQERADGGISDHPDCPSNDKCNPEQMRGTNEPPKGNPSGRGGGQSNAETLNNIKQ